MARWRMERKTMGSDYGPAQWIPSPHFWTGRAGHQPRWIIIHGTAGGDSAQEIAYWFQTDNPPTSTHYVVGRDGAVVQCVNEANSAWGNGVVTQGHDPWWSPQLNPNFLTFSIEHVKSDPGNQEELTQAQQEASFRLIDYLCEKYDIPRRAADANGGITGHYSIDPVNRSFCPGTFPWEELWAYLGGGGEPVGVPSGWKDDGTRLTAPNGKPVVLGFRWYILTHPWAADDWPLESEHYEPVIDITNPQEGGGTVQHFRKSILGWQEHSSDILDLWSGAIALAWQRRAQSNEQSTAPTPVLAPVPAVRSATPASVVNGGANASIRTGANTPARAQPPMVYPGSTGSTDSSGGSNTQTLARSSSRNPQPAVSRTGSFFGDGSVGSGMGSVSGVNGSDDRIASLERQVQLLIDGLVSGGKPGKSSKANKSLRSLQHDLDLVDQELTAPKINRGPFSNAKILLRWVLVLIGLLFSDIVAWAISALIHHDTSLPLPFLTAGTVVLSALFFFLGLFRFQPKP